MAAVVAVPLVVVAPTTAIVAALIVRDGDFKHAGIGAHTAGNKMCSAKRGDSSGGEGTGAPQQASAHHVQFWDPGCRCETVVIIPRRDS